MSHNNPVVPMRTLLGLACLAVCLSAARGYGDGVSSVTPRPPCEACTGKITWRSPQPCGAVGREYTEAVFANASSGLASVSLSLDVSIPVDDRVASDMSRPCVIVSARSSKEAAWWYQMPPSALTDTSVTLCPADGDVKVDATVHPTQQQHLDSSGSVTYRVQGTVTVPAGFTRLSARLAGVNQIAPEAVAVVSVGDHGKSEADLRRAYSTIRNVEDEERGESRATYEANARAYAPIMLHPELAVSTRAQVLDLLHPDLAAALRDGSPEALMSVVRGGDHTSPCRMEDGVCPGVEANGAPQGVYTIPVFEPHVMEMLVAELKHAKESPVGPALSVPNNSGKPRDHRTGVVLEEIGLGGLAETLAGDVLSPFARLLHGAWTPWGIDSYHAFSIHVLHEHGSAPRAEPVSNNRVGDRLPRHVDVCESSMNVCLGNAGFNGSDVYFKHVLGSKRGQYVDESDDEQLLTAPQDLQFVRHVPGRAFINLCQQFHGTDTLTAGERHAIVVRGLSSAFRRAPAEQFVEQCMAVGAAPL